MRRPTMALVIFVALVAFIVGGCGRDGDQQLRSAPLETTIPGTDNPGTDNPETTSPGTQPSSRDTAPGTVASTVTQQAPAPTGIRIPSIDVDAVMSPLGLRSDGSIEVPSDFGQTGWWVDGPEPGEVGPAVVLGHVDSRQGPAVFFDLKALQPGDAIHIDREDGSTVSYVVDHVEKHPKDLFPTNAVYGPTPDPVLRLVTCGGEFDRSVRSYEDNIIVFAGLADR